MTPVKTALLAGAAALALVGSAGLAEARSPATHVLTVQLPGGGIEQIHYTGNVPPTIVLAPDAGLLPGLMPVALMPAASFWTQPFAAFDRIEAQMDREATAMLRQAQAISSQGLSEQGRLIPLSFGKLPAGTESYSFVANLTGNGVCTRSLTITSEGNGMKPRVVSHVSGDCGTANGAAIPTVQPTMPTRRHWPDVVQVKAQRTPQSGVADPRIAASRFRNAAIACGQAETLRRGASARRPRGPPGSGDPGFRRQFLVLPANQ